MLNAELASSVRLGRQLIVVLLVNRGYGCINRLQQACGGAPFNNLLDDCRQGGLGAPATDFAAHAQALGARAENVRTIPELEAALARARASDRTYVVAIPTDPHRSTSAGGAWWEVAVPQVSSRPAVQAARAAYEQEKQAQRP
jgi:3D-(3,5/4)-trihydroxycyclohexane-1,2-dione acylhydrolase (decyclizing)